MQSWTSQWEIFPDLLNPLEQIDFSANFCWPAAFAVTGKKPVLCQMQANALKTMSDMGYFYKCKHNNSNSHSKCYCSTI